MSIKCALCKSGEQHGGSIASQSVVELVECDSFAMMNQQATNVFPSQLQGGARTKKGKRQGKPVRKGGNCVDPDLGFLDSYAIGVATVPASLPAMGSYLDVSGVQGQVLLTLAQTMPNTHSQDHQIVFPHSLVQNQINLTV